MKKKLYISIDDDNDKTCGTDCPFLNHDSCLLFNEDLDETTLPDGYCWQKDADITRERCDKCFFAF